jgi:hypothetical protein
MNRIPLVDRGQEGQEERPGSYSLTVPGRPIRSLSRRIEASGVSATKRGPEPRCSQDCSRDALRHAGIDEYKMGRRCGGCPA